MKAINISKFSELTKHHYVTFWDFKYGYLGKEILKVTELLDPDLYYNKESESEAFKPIKSDNEKDVMRMAKKILNDYCGCSANIILVFYDKKYSASRSEFMTKI